MTDPIQKAIEFCEMVLEIGQADDTVIPVWPIETEMVVTHPLTVGMVRTFLSALRKEPIIEAELQAAIDEATEALNLATSICENKGMPVRVNGITQLSMARLIDASERHAAGAQLEIPLQLQLVFKDYERDPDLFKSELAETTASWLRAALKGIE